MASWGHLQGNKAWRREIWGRKSNKKAHQKVVEQRLKTFKTRGRVRKGLPQLLKLSNVSLYEGARKGSKREVASVRIHGRRGENQRGGKRRSKSQKKGSYLDDKWKHLVRWRNKTTRLCGVPDREKWVWIKENMRSLWEIHRGKNHEIRRGHTWTKTELESLHSLGPRSCKGLLQKKGSQPVVSRGGKWESRKKTKKGRSRIIPCSWRAQSVPGEEKFSAGGRDRKGTTELIQTGIKGDGRKNWKSYRKYGTTGKHRNSKGRGWGRASQLGVVTTGSLSLVKKEEKRK